MTQKHAIEPWPHFIEWCEPATPHPDSDGVVRLGFDDYGRARACVNAMAGIGDDNALFFHGNSVRSVIRSMKIKEQEISQQRDDLQAQVDELLKALRIARESMLRARSVMCKYDDTPMSQEMEIITIDHVIKKITGETK